MQNTYRTQPATQVSKSATKKMSLRKAIAGTFVLFFYALGISAYRYIIRPIGYLLLATAIFILLALTFTGGIPKALWKVEVKAWKEPNPARGQGFFY